MNDPLPIARAVDARGVIARAIDAMRKRGGSLGQAFRTIKGAMKYDQREHAAARSGPVSAWAARAPATLAKAARNRRRAKPPLGRLVSEVDYTSTSTSVSAKSRVSWSDVQQDGGRVGRGAVIPARPFLWISVGLIERAAGIVESAITSEWR